jgi:hypothetical protein
MKRVLIISPHFPPDSSAGTHRARLISKWLPSFGWEPTVLTVDPRDYDSRLDPELASLVPESVRVIRVRALPRPITKPLGFGDLGLRALPSLRSTAKRLVQQESFDVAYITIYPSYPAVIGRTLHETSGIPFVLDYQDPWVGSWGLTVGGGSDGSPDLRSRITRRIALKLEPWTLEAAIGVTAVSAGTFDEVCARNPWARELPFLEMPIGTDPADMTAAARRSVRYFDRDDGCIHVCYVGTLLPLGEPALRVTLNAVARLRRLHPEVGERLRLHFFGTSNQSSGGMARALPIARELGVGDIVDEVPDRIDYLDALAVQRNAHVLLLLGSTEPHYTPSKLYPALLAGRPLFAVYHPASTAREVVSRASQDRAACFIPLDEAHVDSAELLSSAADELFRICMAARDAAPAPVSAWVRPFTAESITQRLGEFLDAVA